MVLTRQAKPRVLLIRRLKEPFAGTWASFAEEGETLLEAVQRELREETGLEVQGLYQIHAAGDTDREARLDRQYRVSR